MLRPVHWADLGCGSGVFTEALAAYLPNGSTITAIDKAAQQVPKKMGDSVNVDFKIYDFEKDRLPLRQLDGILLANSFHFIRDKEALILKLEPCFTHHPTFLLVEYDRDQANPWVPYPIPFEKLKTLFTKLNYHQIEKIGTQKSAYGGAMYASLISKN
ncbi:MAG: hypothetical protein OJF59_000101 [Cytophagales bacterium]|jgi:SAM-dependent methyltransferase|nr:MAG: hypothetical protein OJF59_000101 [Cytophagales bacterium]